MKTQLVLTIAGFDPSGGAGILADIKTIHSLGAYGFAVLTANTIQNENKFIQPGWAPVRDILLQLQTISIHRSFDVVKIGLVESLEVLQTIIRRLRQLHPECRIIWDPVIKSSSGFVFHSAADREMLNEILNSVYLVTPNIPEADFLQLQNGSSYCNVLLKGGHRSDGLSDDVLFQAKGSRTTFSSTYLDGVAKHGSGCVLSSAIATLLAKGFSLEDSCDEAKKYMNHFLVSDKGLLGKHTIGSI